MSDELPKETFTPKFDEWALVELFGHQKIVGKVSECSIAGGAFLRVDVPAIGGAQASPPMTRFYSPGAVYSINPVTEQVARELMSQTRFRNEPVQRWELPQLAEKVSEPEGQEPETNEHGCCPDCGQFVNDCTCD